jgi:hypothetical protein
MNVSAKFDCLANSTVFSIRVSYQHLSAFEPVAQAALKVKILPWQPNKYTRAVDLRGRKSQRWHRRKSNFRLCVFACVRACVRARDSAVE